MSDITVTIPKDFKYVGVALISTTWLLFMQYRTVMAARTKAKIAYPQFYAEKAEMKESEDARLFNCAQRAHGNTLENLPLVYLNTIVVGLRYPILSASLCGLWVIGKVGYTRGYASGNPDKRVNGIYYVGSAGLGEWALKDLVVKVLETF